VQYLTAVRAYLALLALVTVATTAACTKTIPGSQIEKSIHDDLRAKGTDLAGVKCPPKVVLKKGTTLTCTGTDVDGNTASFAVTETDDQGEIDWKLDAQLINTKELGDNLEQTLAAQFGIPIDVKCPDTGIIAKVGRTFRCDATADGNPASIGCNTIDNEGHASCEFHM
jgi:hypothetical protein